MKQMPLDSEFIEQKETRPLWQRILILIILMIILVFSILIIQNLIDIFLFLNENEQVYRIIS